MHRAELPARRDSGRLLAVSLAKIWTSWWFSGSLYEHFQGPNDCDSAQWEGRGFSAVHGLLDADRFEGRDRDGVHAVNASDLMRRLVKEQLLKFDGTPLFPERRAYTVGYKLSDAEAALQP